ncbi:MAG TPA: DUF2092 domain-containing protein [Candidatus Acidoferrales bacterium]|nr:DUF2092 domain-containing protein [Candidatus Acidoferrales bacterium]
MRTTRHLLIALGFIFALAILAGAQTATKQPDPLELLENVQTTYGAMTSFSAKATMHMDMSGTGMQTQTSMAMTLQIDSSGRMRAESAGPIGMTMVNDGTTVWMYMPQENQYFKMPLPSNGSAEAGGDFPFPETGGFSELKNVAKNVKEAKVLRAETVQANGTKVSCWVVSVEYERTGNNDPGPSAQADSTQSDSAQGEATGADFRSIGNANTKMLWIAKTSYLVYREDQTDTVPMPKTGVTMHINMGMTYDDIVVDHPIPQSTFTFTPPAGATEMRPPSTSKTPSKQP